MSAVDWSLGRYEDIAVQLEPAARTVVERAAPVPASTSSTWAPAPAMPPCWPPPAAPASRRRPGERLLEVAREEAAARGLDATFALGEAAALPLADGAADVVLSVFGVIFASDPYAAAAELARVTAPSGRIVLSAWIPGGAVSEAVRAAGEAVRQALGAPAGPPPFPWHERDALAELFAPLGFEVTLEAQRLSFTAESPQAYLDAQAEHPLARAGRTVLEPRGESEALQQRMLAIYEAGNEDPAAFRATSRYVIATARR